MFIELSLLTLIFWLIRTVNAVLFHVYLWQLKEYRFDRFIDHFRYKKNRAKIFSPLFWVRLFYILSLIILFPLPLTLTDGYILFAIPAIYIAENTFIARDILTKQLKKPLFTFKALFLVISSLILLTSPLLYFFWLYLEECFSFCNYSIGIHLTFFLMPFLLTFFVPLTVFLLIMLTKPLILIAKKNICRNAEQRISLFPNLIVIGITGSYGKTSTKEFLAEILSQKYNILKTEAHVNTDIGVAKTVLSKLNYEHQVFVVEMGAYKRGEIKAICDIVKPNIGILTGINEQHLALFGSLENIIDGKFELLESLPKDGLAIINCDNRLCEDNFGRIFCKKVGFSLNDKGDVNAENILITQDEIAFSVSYDNKSISFTAHVFGKHFISNLLPAIYTGLYLKVPIKDIQSAVADLRPFPKTMQKIRTKKNFTIIDDSYNANPDGVILALDYLSVYPKNLKKAIVMPSLIELGSTAPAIHRAIGKKIAKICDYAVFLNKDYISDYLVGMSAVKNNQCKYIIESNPQKIYDFLVIKLKNAGVVLFESRGGEKVIEMLLS